MSFIVLKNNGKYSKIMKKHFFFHFPSREKKFCIGIMKKINTQKNEENLLHMGYYPFRQKMHLLFCFSLIHFTDKSQN